MRYVSTGKMPRSIPTGMVLVHNHVKHEADTPAGFNGFRAWKQSPAAGLLKCKCGWAGLPHYRAQHPPK